MNIIPKVKAYTQNEGICNLEKIAWCFEKNTEKRVIGAAYRLAASEDGVKVLVGHDDGDGEGYIIDVSENQIKIHGEGGAGAFYALSTLKMLINQGKGKVKCCHIEDRPDQSYRGFYQDTTRGRLATVETLKRLVDTMADYKMNSLQLYVEHTFEFKEYEFCRDLGYYTADEIREIDAYCKERYIDLVPSLSTFGHLYTLLDNEKYKHLCELSNFISEDHRWYDRMQHHTINPLLDESFEVVKSLIDQHMAAFTSEYFNICCDETFDLGTDVNEGKDKDTLYIDYVLKLVKYVNSKGKKVMMWGDSAVTRSGRLSEFPMDTVFLNWGYNKDSVNAMIPLLKDRKQCVCPGTSTWLGFCERVSIEEGNITGLARQGYENGAMGILNTNWGDFGNPASIDMAMYGMILGACLGWNKNTTPDADFRKDVSLYHYGNAEAVNVLERLGDACCQSDWLACNYNVRGYKNQSFDDFNNAQKTFGEIIEEIKGMTFANEHIKNEFLIAAKAHSLLCTWSAKKYGHDVQNDVDFNAWLKDYKKAWLTSSKKSELEEMINVINGLQNAECKFSKDRELYLF